MQILVLIGAVGASPHMGEILPLWLFCLTVLSCPCLFFSGTRSGRTAEPIFTLYGSNDVCPRKEVPFMVCTVENVIWGNIPPTPPPIMGVNRQFQAKTAKYKKNRNSSKIINRIKTKFEDRAETDSCTSWVVSHYPPHQIQQIHCRLYGHHLEKIDLRLSSMHTSANWRIYHCNWFK